MGGVFALPLGKGELSAPGEIEGIGFAPQGKLPLAEGLKDPLS